MSTNHHKSEIPGAVAIPQGLASLLKTLPPQTPAQQEALRVAIERVTANTARAMAEAGANGLKK